MVARPYPYSNTPDAPSDTSVNPRPRQMTLPGIGEQNLPRPSLGTGGEDDPSTPSRAQVKLDALAEYGGESGAHYRGPGLSSPNPLYAPDEGIRQSQQSVKNYKEGLRPTRQDEFIPPWRVYSEQPKVNPEAIEHQIEHANPLDLVDDPSVTSYRGADDEEAFMVYNGNHRVNAAQRRGQLLMPANVARYDAPNYHRGPNSVRRSRA